MYSLSSFFFKKNCSDHCVFVCVVCCVLCVVCVCVFTSIHREGFICLDQLGYYGTDQRCCVENVGFLCRFPSLLLWNAEPNLSASHFILFIHQKRAQPRLNQYTSHFQNIRPSFTIIRRRLRCALHREPICFCVSTQERVHNHRRVLSKVLSQVQVPSSLYLKM